MATLDDATRKQLANIEAASGRSIPEWFSLVRGSGLTRAGEIRKWLIDEHGLTYGNANLVALQALKPDDAPVGEDQIDAIYAGKNAAVRPLHDAVMAAIGRFGSDIEVSPKKSYVALRRRKQFAMVGPGTGGRLDVGINLPDAPVGGRMEQTTGMAPRRVRVSDRNEIDAELIGWLRTAYDRS